jgi:hypothetical protein
MPDTQHPYRTVTTYANRQDLANKAEWEGGIIDMLFGYGLKPEDVPEDDTELREAIAEALKAGRWIAKIENMLPEPGGDDDD